MVTSSHPLGSIEEFCASHVESDLTRLPNSARLFLERLGLPTSHPFCDDLTSFVETSDIPPSGPLAEGLLKLHDFNVWETAVTLYYMIIPSFMGFAELLIHTFSGYVVPIAFAVLIRNIHLLQRESKVTLSKMSTIISSIVAVYGSLIIMTSSAYVLEFGMAGLAMYIVSVPLAFYACKLSQSIFYTRIAVLLSVVVAFFLTFDRSTNKFHLGFPADVDVKVNAGLYYAAENPLIKSVVEKHWHESKRTYNIQTGATPYLLTGDARTLLPYIFNRVATVEWTRVYLQLEDQEVLALDVTFPEDGHDFSKPIYLIFHGMNMASDAGYAHDLARRQTAAGSTVIVMIARGYAELPMKSWKVFHIARVSDIHYTAKIIRNKTMFVDPEQSMVGIGYSVGAMILPNYVALSGPDCQLDAAFAVSGALDLRRAPYLHPRGNRLWQSLVSPSVRRRYLKKWGQMTINRLSRQGVIALLRVRDSVEFEETFTVKYYGEEHFKDLDDLYSQTTLLGDIPMENFDKPFQNANETAMSEWIPSDAKINQVSIPLCVLVALDDPAVQWGASVANEGIMHPQNIVHTGSKNVVLLLTATGGHVGWPTGWSFGDNWKWVNEAASSFFDAVIAAKLEEKGCQEDEINATCIATN